MAFVDAPVSGSSQPAEDGQLVILASGAGPVRSRVEPIFDVLGRQTLWLERVGEGSRLKLALNNWLAVLVEGMAETLTLSSALGLDPHLFLATIAGGPLASPYATNKGTAMLDADFAPGFPLAARRQGCRARHRRRPRTTAWISRSPRPCCAAGNRPSTLGHGADDVASAITIPAVTSNPDGYR